MSKRYPAVATLIPGRAEPDITTTTTDNGAGSNWPCTATHPRQLEEQFTTSTAATVSDSYLRTGPAGGTFIGAERARSASMSWRRRTGTRS